MKPKILIPLLFLFFTFSLISCNDDDSPPSVSVNDFIWKAMNLWYYWQEDVPDLSDNRFSTEADYHNFLNSKQSDALFYSLLYDYGNTDRFSWIVNDYHDLQNSLAGIKKDFGMKYGLVYLSHNSNEILGYVRYVLPNTPAESAGLKRGDIFIKINGQQLTDSNYSDLLGLDHATFGMGKIHNGQVVDLQQEISLTKVIVEENPVFLTKVFNKFDRKIGYLVYNGFRANYNSELNAAIGNLASQGITDLILDLRYNGGGAVQTSAYLGSMITGNLTGQTFTHLKFNHKAADNDQTFLFEDTGKTFDENFNETGNFVLNHLNLNKLYVITTQSTASASEMLIHCLKPYIEVKVIGSRTYGKTVGSITLYDSPSSSYTSKNGVNSSHTWAMQPIVFGATNSQNFPSPVSGIQPDYDINELEYLNNFYPLGSEGDILLATTFNYIGNFGKPTLPDYPFEGEVLEPSRDLNAMESEMYLVGDFPLNP